MRSVKRLFCIKIIEMLSFTFSAPSFIPAWWSLQVSINFELVLWDFHTQKRECQTWLCNHYLNGMTAQDNICFHFGLVDEQNLILFTMLSHQNHPDGTNTWCRSEQSWYAAWRCRVFTRDSTGLVIGCCKSTQPDTSVWYEIDCIGKLG